MEEGKKSCPQCNQPFTCNPGNCWCSELPLTFPPVAGAACLCPACLQKAIDKFEKEKVAKEKD